MIRTTFGTTVALCLFAIALTPARAGMVVGIFDTTRATTANIASGLFTHDMVASLQTHFPGTTFSSAPTLTPAFLSGVDILMIGSPKTDSEAITPLSASEQTAMLDFVKAGGRAFVIADGFGPFIPAAQSMVSPFGVTIADDGLSGVLTGTPIATSHPVINGPHGLTSTIYLYGTGVFTNLGPSTPLVLMDANSLPTLAAIESHALGPTSGRVVLMADSSTLVDSAVGGIFSLYEPLFLNTIDYLSVPEPSGLLMAVMAGAALVLAARGRRSKRQ